MESWSFSTPLEKIPFISATWRKKLANLAILTSEDLLYHFPFRYDDFTQFKTIAQLGLNETVTIRGEVVTIQNKKTWGRRRLAITEAWLRDQTDSVKVTWFNLSYPLKSLKKGSLVEISGKTSLSKTGELHFSHPNFQLLSKQQLRAADSASDSSLATGSLLAIYPETKGLTSFWLRKTIKRLLNTMELKEFLPKQLLTEQSLPTLEDALWSIHFPENSRESALAKKRFAFERMFLLQLKTLSLKAKRDKNQAPPLTFKDQLIQEFVASLPFTLTTAQKKAAWQIIQDLEKNIPMNRLLEGDVGSGKTVVAALAVLSTIANRFQAALLAPTEVLAVQHYAELNKLFRNLGYSGALLTGTHSKIGSKTVKKKELTQALLAGKIDFIVGTHALLQDSLTFKKLALLAIDEQHRFGVRQRAYLQQSALKIADGTTATIPHLLTMTATPIPRTLALALFGNLALSVIDEYPQGRKKVITKVINSQERAQVYSFVKQEISQGRQVFLIYPLVEESSKVSQVKAATAELEKLQRGVFSQFKLALLHGKMKAKEKEQVMGSFRKGEAQILVATSVVEVGVDIPNASVMLIEGAERFGLAQLHQFRGRVGRGNQQAYCFLITSDSAPTSTKRLKIMEQTNNGFKIANEDMRLRGPGQFMGLTQSGVPDIAMESLSDLKTIQLARTKAQKLLKKDQLLTTWPLLQKRIANISTNVHWE